METVTIPKSNPILGSPYEKEINDLRFAGYELQQIVDHLFKKRNFKTSISTLSKYFTVKKELSKIASKDVENHLKNTFKEEYMDLAGRITFFNSVILEAKRRFEKEKQNLTLIDLMNLAAKLGDSLQKIEGADAQNDLIRQFASLILEIKTEQKQQVLPIVELSPDGLISEITTEPREP
jgi:hypothetical protein